MKAERPANKSRGQHEREAPETADTGSFSKIFGALKGTVTIMPGTDLTLPTGEAWDAEE